MARASVFRGTPTPTPLVRWNLKRLAISYRVGRCRWAADLPRDLELYAVTSSSQELPSPALPMPSRLPSRNIIVRRVGSGWS